MSEEFIREVDEDLKEEKRLKIIQEYSKIYDLLTVKDTTKKIASSIFS